MKNNGTGWGQQRRGEVVREGSLRQGDLSEVMLCRAFQSEATGLTCLRKNKKVPSAVSKAERGRT